MRASSSSHSMDASQRREHGRRGAFVPVAGGVPPGKPLRWQPRWWPSRGRLLRFAIALAGLWVAYQLLSGDESVLVGLSARRERVQLESETAALKSRSEALRYLKARVMKDPAFLEQVAREQQGMCRDGEKIAVVLPPEPQDE